MDRNIDSKLSKRMLAVADMVLCSRHTVPHSGDMVSHSGQQESYSRQTDKLYRVADIGCDHAFVSIYLVQQGIADKVIAMDVNKGPLEAAQKNIKDYGSDGSIETRLSNGFDALRRGETDAAVIAGMGGKLVISIIDAADVFEPGYKLILSPQSDVREVRLYLLERGFRLLDEDMICEDGKYYNIICAEFEGISPVLTEKKVDVSSAENSGDTARSEKKEGNSGDTARSEKKENENSGDTAQPDNGEDEDQILLEYGENLIKKKNPVFKEYLEKRRISLSTIYNNLAEPCSPLVVARREEIKKELDEIETVLRIIN